MSVENEAVDLLQRKLVKLAKDWGFDDVEEYLADPACFTTGICVNPDCGYTNDTCESGTDSDCCDSCETNTLVCGSALDMMVAADEGIGDGPDFAKQLIERKLLKLAQSQGSQTVQELMSSLDRGEVQGPVPGICMLPNCDHIDAVEPSALAEWCSESEKYSMRSVLELKDEID